MSLSPESSGQNKAETDPTIPDVSSVVKSEAPLDSKPVDSVVDEKEETTNISASRESCQEVDPYDYLNKVEFTSERYKVEIKGMHRQVGFKQLKNRMRALGLKPHKVKILSWGAFVTFMSAEDRDKAISDMNGNNWKGKKLSVSIAKPRTDPGLETLKRKQKDGDGDSSSGKQQKLNNLEEMDPAQKLMTVVTPLSNMPYDDQLKVKTQRIRELLCVYYKKVIDQNILLMDKLLTEKNEENGLLMICPIKPIQHSTALTYYRNKCEFTIGKDLEGRDHVVGFNYGKYKGGHTNVGSPAHLINISKSIETVRSTLETFIRNKLAHIPTYDTIEYSGFWRTALIRSTQSCDTMMGIEAYGSDWDDKNVVEASAALKEYFSSVECQHLCLRSLYFILRQRQSDAITEANCRLMFGDTYLIEECMGLKFQISISAFFQVNTRAAEVLYSKIQELCTTGNNVIVLDLYCGTGTIGLCVAKSVYKVYGIEMCADAVEDAEANAKRNSIENVEFTCGKVEVVLPKILRQVDSDKEIIAIVDPPRAGLHSHAIGFLRKHVQVKTVIYVSCNPEASSTNFVDLGRQESNRMRGTPFIPIEATPVDLFPQTKHVELVTLWKRLTE